MNSRRWQCNFVTFVFIILSKWVATQERFHIDTWYECFLSAVLVQRKFRQKFGKHTEVPSVLTIKNIFRKASEDGNLDLAGQADHEHPPMTLTSGKSKSLSLTTLKHQFTEDRKSCAYQKVPFKEFWQKSWKCIHTDRISSKNYRMMIKSNASLSVKKSFSCWIMTKLSSMNSLLFTDEANFHISRNVNRHNCRFWSEEINN